MSVHRIPTSVEERLAAALRRRLYPNSNLHIKQLSHAIQVSEQAISSWLSGLKMPRGDHLLRLISFFDAGFANEIVDDCVVYKLQDAKQLKDAKTKINDALAAIAWLKSGT